MKGKCHVRERDGSIQTSDSYVVEPSCGLDDVSMATNMTDLQSYIVKRGLMEFIA